MDTKQVKNRGENKVRVLLIDDSLIVIARLMTLLSDLAGVEVVGQAHDIMEGEKQFRKLKPDVVVLDIQMPGGSGIELLLSIKKNAPSTTVIMATNYPYMQYRQKCREAGADHFLDKFTEFETIVSIVAGHVHDVR